MTDSVSVAIVAAVAAAVSFALTGMLQHRATARAPRRRALRPGLLVDLAHQPLWLLSIGAGLTGFALQAAALRFGPLALVQPILAMQILIAPLLASAVYHRSVDRDLLFGAALAVTGLSIFLVAGDPGGAPARATGVVSSRSLLVVLLVVVLVAALVRPFLARRRRWPRAIALALGSGALYGVTAGLLKITVDLTGQGWTGPLTSWTLYALLIAGPLGFLLNQNAFQAGSLVAPLAVIMVTDPLVAIGIGLLWLNERLNAAPWAVVAQLAGLAVMAIGIVLLAHRSSRAPAKPGEPSPGPSGPDPCPSCA